MEKTQLLTQLFTLWEQQIGKPYVRGGKDEAGFDCSGFVLWLFSQMGLRFAARFRTVEFFAGSKAIERRDAQAWDLMFWHEEPGKNEHNFVYHIEILLEQPFEQEGRRYVKTLWSSRTRDCYDLSGNNLDQEGVAIRTREIDQRKSFASISYYDQLLKYQETWTINDLFVPLPQDVKSRFKL